MKIVSIIPARYQSSRFPGKPLADICGKPMIWWVYHQCKKVKDFAQVYVATDDERIEKVCNEYNISYKLTRKDHATGASRVQELSETIKADFYVQVNGDEPLIDENAIKAVIPTTIPQNIEFGTNIITKINNPTEVLDSSNIKMVFDNNYNALYMSRTPIPYPFKSINFSYYKHVGIIGYNKKMLDFYKKSTPGMFETIEGIDTLRFLDYAKQLKLIEINKYDSLSVDTEKDLEKVRKIMERRNG